MNLRSIFQYMILLLPMAVSAEAIYGISVPSESTELFYFDSAQPSEITTVGSIRGILENHKLRAIDFRPSNGQLYAFSSLNSGEVGQIYTIDLQTAVATPVGPSLHFSDYASIRFSMDFNPVSDLLIVISGRGQSYQIDADKGEIISQGVSILDPLGKEPLLTGLAFTNNFVGATETMLYAYDFLTDHIFRIDANLEIPYSKVVGESGFVSQDGALGFDISGASGVGYLSFDDYFTEGYESELFVVNLDTGHLTQISDPDWNSVLDVSVRPIQ